MLSPSPDLRRVTQADFAACRALLREGSKSFFAASLLLPERVRHPVAALYAFCRVADDCVDLRRDRAEMVDALRRRVDHAYAGRPLPDPVDRAFAWAVERHAIPRALPDALLEGFAWDVQERRYETLPALNAYAARVAGTVGAMMTLVMGVRDPAAVARACDLGVAMQLTNIARDVGEDARAGRLYLPERWLREAGVEPDEWLARPGFDERIAHVVRRLLDAADRLYRRAEGGIGQLPMGCRPAIAGARYVYAEIGRQVERQGLDSIGQRAVVGAGCKVRLLARALLATPLPRRPDPSPPLDEVRFLVDAVAATPPPPQVSQSFDDRVAWVLELFDRLERRDELGSLATGQT
jgi:phytoene synthase